MAKKLLFCIIVPFTFLTQIYAANLDLIQGHIKAHTQVFGDSTIDPETNKVTASLNMQEGIESLKGEIKINALDLISDNKDRDAHMYETLGSENFPVISFDLAKIVKIENIYQIEGIMNLHGVTKNFSIPVDITQNNGIVEMHSMFTIKMSDFNIEAPKLLFLTVRDEVDITVDLKLKGE